MQHTRSFNTYRRKIKMNIMHSILIIVTGFSEMGSGEPTGLWLEEFSVPYQIFSDKGYKITVASIKGGKTPIDPKSTPTIEQKKEWAKSLLALENTQPLSSLKSEDFDAIFIPGGHGTMFDFPENASLQALLQDFAENNKIIASVCHGPASLVGVTLKDGTPLVSGKTMTSFTNEEEEKAGLTQKMPFLLESRLKALGAQFISHPNWSDHVEIDGNLITGQNPQSSKSIALAIIKTLTKTQGQ